MITSLRRRWKLVKLVGKHRHIDENPEKNWVGVSIKTANWGSRLTHCSSISPMTEY